MEDAPNTATELPAVQEELPMKDVDKEPSVSNLTTEQSNQAMREQHDESMEQEPASAGAEADTKPKEEEHTTADEEANVNAGVAEEVKGEDEDVRINAEKESQAEADMIDEHHGETVVEAEEDTVIY